MALFSATVTEVTGQGYDLFGGIGVRLLNSARMSELEVNGTGSVFKYATGSPADKSPYCRIKCSDSVATLVTASEVSLASSVLELSGYPNRDTSLSTSTLYVGVSSVVVGIEYLSYTLIRLPLISFLVSETIDVVVDRAGTTVPANASLNEDGTPLLNEDGNYLLNEN